MSSKAEACAECTRKCLLCHVKKKNSTPLVSSFFKVMITDRFSEVLFLPPKFAPMVSALVDQEIPLEDSNGLKWKVKLTTQKNSLAFHQGWDTFALDHGLRVGDFVIFHYISRSHFVVRIFDKAGYEKLDFSEKCDQGHSTDKGSMGKQGSNSSPSLQSNDVPNIKKPIGRSSSNKNGVVSPQAVSKKPYFSPGKLEENLKPDEKNKSIPTAEKSSHCGDTSVNPHTKPGSNSERSPNEVPVVAWMSSMQLNKNVKSISSWSNRAHSRCQTDKAAERAQSSGKQNVIDVEEDDQVITLTRGSKDEDGGEMVLVDTNTSSSPSECSISCLIGPNHRPFLELLAALPSKKKISSKERRMVQLKGPDMMQWPVIYHQTPNLRLLMSGWEAFCLAYDIQPGDECTFGIENIIHRSE